MMRWEYAEMDCDGTSTYVYCYENGGVIELKGFKSKHKVLEALHELGEPGWELVAATRSGDMTIYRQVLWLKRQEQK